MQKEVKQVWPLSLEKNRMGFTSVDMFYHEFNFEPFLVFTEFHMDRAIFGPHPHAGISVMTYMLPDSAGSFLNRDSLGDHSIIEPGGVHVTQAGSGVHHDEVPTVEGVDCHGFQIWINHSDKDRLVAPKAFHLSAAEVPVYKDASVQLRVIQGGFRGLSSPIRLVTDTSLFDVTLQPRTVVEFDVQEMAFIYLMKGNIHIGEQEIAASAMINFEQQGNSIQLQTGEEAAHFIFASGTPHREPIVQGGPFVMTTASQMQATQDRYRRGEMGTL